MSLLALPSPLALAQGGGSSGLPLEPVWELAAWAEDVPGGVHQTQATSGEDWFFSITESRTAAGVQDGFVAVGYSTYPTLHNTACVTDPGTTRGRSHATIVKVSPGGEVEWFRDNGIEGGYWRVRNTSDGGFIAVGSTLDRSEVLYNPYPSTGDTPHGAALDCWPGDGRGFRILIATKFDHDGEIVWQYAYGRMADPNLHLPCLSEPCPLGEQQFDHDHGFGVVERPEGGFRIVGQASDPGDGMNAKAFVVDVDADGMVESSWAYGAAGKKSGLMGIARAGNVYVAVGTQYDGTFDPAVCPGDPVDFDENCPWGEVAVIRLGATLTPTPLAQRLLTSTSEVQDTGMDVAFAGDGTVFVSAILACEGLDLLGQCFRFGEGGVGEGVVYKLDPADLSPHATYPSVSLGEVKTWGLYVGLTSLSNGNVAVVSSKQTVPPGAYEFDDIHAYVAVLSPSLSFVASTIYEARTAMFNFQSGRDPRRECLWEAAEAADGGLVIAGNNSSNLDDSYVVRFDYGGSATTLPAPSVAYAHLVYPTRGAPHALTLTGGDLAVEHDGRLWVDPTRTLKLEESRRLVVEGELLADGATLTAASPSLGWGGILARRPSAEAYDLPPVALTGSIVEHVRRPASGALLPYGAVEVHDRAFTLDGGSQIRLGAGGTVGLLATGASVATVDGLSVIRDNDGGGLRATGGAEVVVTGDSRIEFNPGVGVRADGYGTEVFLLGARVLGNGGVGVRALSQALVQFGNDDSFPETYVEDNLSGGLDAGSGGSLDAGQCTSASAPCPGRREHRLLRNSFGGHFDARSLTGSVLYAQGNVWHTTDVTQLVLVQDSSSVLVVCPLVGGGVCEDDDRLAGGTPFDAAHGTRRVGAEGGKRPGGEPPLRLRDVLALVDAAERARLAGDAEAFDLAATAAVAALDTSQAEDARRAAFEVTARLFAWAQPEGPLADLAALAAQPGEGRPWALRALGVARAAAEDYTDARAVADTLASGYAGSEHAAFGYALAVRVAVLEHDETAAVAALLALAAAFPGDDALGGLAALVLGAFPEADLSGLSGGARLPGTAAPAGATAGVGALLALGEARPNPASDRASVPFALSSEAEVEAVLYDVLGRRLAVLAEGPYPAGHHTLSLDGSALPSGVYVVAVTARSGAAPVAVGAQRLTITR